MKLYGKNTVYMKSQNRLKVCVVGAGAAGMMSAIRASELGADVTLFEKNKSQKIIETESFFDNAYLGKKLLITGKGRCNVTNDCTLDEFMKNVPTGSKFMYAAFNSFTSRDVMDFFENAGTPLKVERGNRVFPVSDKSLDILKSLKKRLVENNVRIVNKKVCDIVQEDGVFKAVALEDDKQVFFDRCIIATGGKSYPQTGSDGDGYEFAQKCGHTVKDLKPSLVPIVAHDKACRDMMGLSLKNVCVSVLDNNKNKVIFKETGEMLFTHFGMSGPLILSASSHIRNFEKGRYTVSIDLKPALDEKTLDNRLLIDFNKYINKNMDNALSDLLPSKMIIPFLNKCGIKKEQKPNSITKEERRVMLETLKAFKIEIDGFRPIDEAIITSGGINTKEINPSTMESKIVSGLYFAGEIIDVDAYTGGFNLQIAFSTGYLAGTNAASEF